MRFDIITVLPELLASPLSHSIMQRARDRGLLEVHLHHLRDYAPGKHRQVDDYPFGGGAGMVMKPEPIAACLDQLLSERSYDQVIYTSPDGIQLNQGLCNRLSLGQQYIILCGHYKGVDERIREKYITMEISIGDYVLSGGELAAAVIVDSIGRLIPGVLNDETSALLDSFQDNLLAPPVSCFDRTGCRNTKHETLQVELDPLCQRHRLRVVNRVGLSAHIGFPGIRAGFSPAARLFFTAECPADLGAGSADVHIGDAAIGAGHGKEPFRIAQIASHNGRGKSLWHPVLQGDGLFDRAVFDQVQDRGEGLVLHDLPMIFNLCDAGFYVTAALVAGAFKHTAFHQESAAVLFDFIDSFEIVFNGVFVNQRSDVVVRVERIADAKLRIGFDQGSFHLIVYAFVDNQATGGRATLPCSADRSEHRAGEHDLHIRRRRDDDGVVAAQFEEAATEAAGHGLSHDATHARTAGGADERDTSIFRHVLADFIIAIDDAADAFRQIIGFQHLLK